MRRAKQKTSGLRGYGEDEYSYTGISVSTGAAGKAEFAVASNAVL